MGKKKSHAVVEMDSPEEVAGAKTSAEGVVQRHGGYLRRVVWHCLGPSQEFEDVVQEALLQVVRSAHSIRNGDSEKGFVRSVAVFTVRKHIRSRSRWFWRQTELDEAMMASRQMAPEAREQLRALYDALEAMGTEKRLVWTLRFIHRLTVEEVAETLQVSRSTAKRRIAAAMDGLEKRARRNPVLAEIIWAEGNE